VEYVDESEAPGLFTNANAKGVRTAEVVKRMHDKGLKPYMIGGFIRDILMNKPSDDVDLNFASTNEELLAFAKEIHKEGWIHGLKEGGKPITVDKAQNPSYISIGDQNKPFALEGKVFSPNAAGVWELSFKDFTFNEFLYDPIGHELIDPSGHGIEDVLNMQLRIPHDVTDPQAAELLKDWLDDPKPYSRLYRWFKFRARGYTPADPAQLKWIIDTLITNIADKVLRKEFLYHLAKEFIAKQQGTPDDKSKQTAGLKLAAGFLKGFVEDIEEATSKEEGAAGTDGKEWFKNNILPWLTDEVGSRGNESKAWCVTVPMIPSWVQSTSQLSKLV
jgi:hypothetical protein